MVGKYVLQISVREFNDLIKSELNGELKCLWKGQKTVSDTTLRYLLPKKI